LATPAAAPTSAGGDFAGLFSQNYAPAFAQPGEIGALRASISGHARVRIDVDENGHATDVRFTPAIGDSALAEELRTKLLSLRYVPADCNGLPCDGILDVLL
jgi:outer membrane biosynthesis protein TonB